MVFEAATFFFFFLRSDSNDLRFVFGILGFFKDFEMQNLDVILWKPKISFNIVILGKLTPLNAVLTPFNAVKNMKHFIK